VSTNLKVMQFCNFCGKNQTQVETLISGNGVFICNECVALCTQVIATKQEPKPEEKSKSKWNPPEITKYLDEYVIGQEIAKKTLAVAIYNHLKRIAHPVIDGVTIDKSNILLIGSSGVGKSHVVSTLAQILEVPFAVVDATSLSQTGYVGLDPEECLARLYHAADNDLTRAEIGIVFIDEFDKIARKSGENMSTTRDVSGEGVQQALLKIIEGSDVKFTPTGARKNPSGDFVTINTRNILFILGGAFEGIDQCIATRTDSPTREIGFVGEIGAVSAISKFDTLQRIEAEDLISYGMLPEIVGRIPVIVPFRDLDMITLVRILTEPKNALIKQFQKIFSLENIELEFTPESIECIAQQVIKSRTGARGLRRVLERVLLDTQYLIQELRGQGVKRVTVTADTVKNNSEPNFSLDS
jgi:ATP-dependent Clp protease ATP-binding subunit ClpX